MTKRGIIYIFIGILIVGAVANAPGNGMIIVVPSDAACSPEGEFKAKILTADTQLR